MMSSSGDYLIRGADFLEREVDFKLVGRFSELERLTGILMRDKANSVLLVGAGGVGCTAICMGLQARKKEPNAPFDIVNKRLFWLDVDGLFSSGDPQKINDGFQRALTTLTRSRETILIIEDVKNFIEAARNVGCSHLLNALMREARNNRFQVILECRDDGLELVLKSHSDMQEIFTLLEILEPESDALTQIVSASAKRLEQHHGINISPEAVEQAILQTSKYRVSDLGLSRAQPERSLTLLDRALTSYRLKCHAKPPRLQVLESKQAELATQIQAKNGDAALGTALQKVTSEIDLFLSEWLSFREEIKKLTRDQSAAEECIREIEVSINQELSRGAEVPTNNPDSVDSSDGFSVMGRGFEPSHVREMRVEIERFQKQIDQNKARYQELSDHINKDLQLLPEHVLAEFSKISGIPVSKLSQDERLKLLGLKENLENRVYGQSHAVDKLANAICVARAGLQDINKPQASFLFLGPSGVGKTELAKALTVALMDDERSLLRFDMSEYMEKHAVAKLIGAPPGYEGYEAGGILTNALRKNPNRIILFDEIEKAHPDVFNVFLQILDDARLTDNRGLTVSFRDCVIIMTTNIGTSYFLDSKLAADEAYQLAMTDLNQQYRPEFLNRFNGRRNIVCFNRLELPIIQKIALRELVRLNDMIHTKSSNLTISMPDQELAAMCQSIYEPVNGARGVTGYIADVIKPTIANTLLSTPDLAGVIHARFDSATQKVILDVPVVSAATNHVQ